VPELPEVETLRADLEREVVGQGVVAASATGLRTFRRYGLPPGGGACLAGRSVLAVERRGKYLVVRLSGPLVVVVHLGMSGQLRAVEADAPPIAHTHAAVSLTSGRQVRFVDPRTFGEIFVSAGDAPDGVPLELAHLGPDPLSAGFGRAELAGLLAARRTRLKPLLLDQRVVAGIGNLYADEVLWAARLAPDRPAGSLGVAAVARLHQSLREVLGAAIAYRGSSLADAQYRDLAGRVGGYQARHAAYGREGQPCQRCGRAIRRRHADGRSTFYCTRCQR